MRNISTKELDRLKKREGVKVTRRLGTGKKPEPEVKDNEALSGAKESATPAPVSDELNSVMSQVTEILSRQADGPLQLVKEEMNGKVKDLEANLTTASKAISKQEQANKDLKAIIATTSEAILEQERVNKDLEKRISKRSEPNRVEIINPVSKSYFPEYDESEEGKFISPVKPKLKSKWMHVLHRDESGYMNQIISTDQSGNQWVHDILRSSKNLIAKILSKPNH